MSGFGAGCVRAGVFQDESVVTSFIPSLNEAAIKPYRLVGNRPSLRNPVELLCIT